MGRCFSGLWQPVLKSDAPTPAAPLCGPPDWRWECGPCCQPETPPRPGEGPSLPAPPPPPRALSSLPPGFSRRPADTVPSSSA
ncbi:uncharacterized protein LOC129145595 isoform X2 [Talpa occidentalis]|uniref:uncharacterized protein LOC129145595 isoform X2 n=1 Tax=Talpa occidentalis TaxID=50954 RepID=UPI0023F7A08A|nr:uncharacterized protein LOC129145595 isoform X2 [Talpa occidentalis]